MPQCLIALGCNQGNCLESFRSACHRIRGLPQTEVVAISSACRTPPVGMPPSDVAFLNAAVCIRTVLQANELIAGLARIETQMGRKREQGADRRIDLDLLLCDQQIIETEQLVLPHPRMSFRRFVLEPSVEIAPDWIHPICHVSLRQLLEHLNTADNLIALSGPTVKQVSEFCRAVQRQLPEYNIELRRSLAESLPIPSTGHDTWQLMPQVGEKPSVLADATDEIKQQNIPTVKMLVRMPDVACKAWSSFRGPKLDLADVADTDVADQLSAAIQAMVPIGKTQRRHISLTTPDDL